MNYFVCTYGYFPEQEELVERSFREKVYLLHQYARYPSAIDDVKPDDVLLLNVRGLGVVAFATSAGCVIHRNEADEWNHVLVTRDGWHKGKNAQYSTYGISWATLQGGQFSLVKRVEAAWAEKILAEMGWESPLQDSDNNIPDVPFRDMTPRSVAKELMDGVLDIPPLQRGFVWNATRLEVLWDSIMHSVQPPSCPHIVAFRQSQQRPRSGMVMAMPKGTHCKHLLSGLIYCQARCMDVNMFSE